MSTNDPSIAQLFDLSGRVALLTGGAGHLGTAMAAALAEAGASVIVTSRQLERATAAAEHLPRVSSARHAAIALDQLDLPAIERAFEDAMRLHERIDILVNNAFEPVGNDWRDISLEDFSRVQDNITAYFSLARHVRNHAFSRHSAASIIFVGSMYGLVASYPDVYQDLGAASSVAYHAAKGGVLQMARHLAVYWARDNVRVNCLSPGPFSRDVADPRLVERLRHKCPMQRIGRPWEIKGAIVFLASDASSYMTGHNLVVDGGWTAW